MAKIILDTCSWLDLAKPKFYEIFNELCQSIDRQELILLTNEIILEEWDRHKDKAITEVVASIKAHAKSALFMAELLDDESSQKLKDVVLKYKDHEEVQIKFATDYIEKIDELLKSAIVIRNSEETKLMVVNRSLTLLAPFHNKKNNVADALIFFSTLKFMDKEYKIANDLLFISANYKEFSDPKDHDKLHPDLSSESKCTYIHFFDNLGKALKMKSDIVDELDEYHEYQFWSWIETEAEIARGK